MEWLNFRKHWTSRQTPPLVHSRKERGRTMKVKNSTSDSWKRQMDRYSRWPSVWLITNKRLSGSGARGRGEHKRVIWNINDLTCLSISDSNELLVRAPMLFEQSCFVIFTFPLCVCTCLSFLCKNSSTVK